MNADRLETLINGLIDGWLNEAGRAELIEALRHSAQARSVYWRTLRAHHELIEFAERDQARELGWDAVWATLEAEESRAELELVDLSERYSTPAVRPPAAEAESNHNEREMRDEVFSFAGITVYRNVSPSRGGAARPSAGRALRWAAVVAVVGLLGWLALRPAPPQPAPQQADALVVPSPPVDPAPVEPAPAVARVDELLDVVWASSETVIAVGGELQAGAYELARGMLQLTLADGAVVLVEGPSRFELIDANAMRLDQGRLGAQVLGPIKGLKVLTPGSQITDLGTVFYVDVNAAQQTRAATLDGLITIQPRDEQGPYGEAVALAAGQAAAIDQTGRFISLLEGTDRDVAALNPFERQRLHKLGIESLIGEIDLREDLPLSEILTDPASQGRITLIREAAGLTADQSILLDTASPIADARISQSLLLAPGTRFDSYLLIYKTSGFPNTQELETASGGVRFLNAPLGLQHTKESMDLFAVLVGDDRLAALPEKLGVYHAELTDPTIRRAANGGDLMRFEPDGRSISFEFSAISADIVRILVPARSAPAQPGPGS